MGQKVIIRFWWEIQKPSHHFLQTFRPLSMFKIVLRNSSLYPRQSRAYARGVGLTPLELDTYKNFITRANEVD